MRAALSGSGPTAFRQPSCATDGLEVSSHNQPSKKKSKGRPRKKKGICPCCGTWRNEYIRQPWVAANNQANPVRCPLAHDLKLRSWADPPFSIGLSEGASPWTTMVSMLSCNSIALLSCRNLTGPGECKKAMMSYLSCMKKVRGVNEDECRNLAKAYLTCRMDR